MTFLTFPKGFFWGTASSGPQTEGRFEGDGKGENIWDYWYDKEPEKLAQIKLLIIISITKKMCN